MLPLLFLSRLCALLIFSSLLSTSYVYLYPLAHRCGFPTPSAGQLAPFRLLAFGDPQLEGDTSLPQRPEFETPNLHAVVSQLRDRDFHAVRGRLRSFNEDVRSVLFFCISYARKQIDLIGNDYYLAHIFRTLHWWANPTHVTVLGDLIGSQWIDDDEFTKRSDRFWSRVFRGTEKVPADVIDANFTGEYKPRLEPLGDDPRWRRRIINVAGNHDVGYAGDLDADRIERFEREFGPVNGDIWFTLPLSDGDPLKALRVIVLNSMNLDGPSYSSDLQAQTINFVNTAMGQSTSVGDHEVATILLTHIPLHKSAGTCVDEPFFSYFPDDNGGGIEEQNMLSEDSSRNAILQGLFGMSTDGEAAAHGMGRDGIILTGHDHEGCDVYHYADRDNNNWTAQRWSESNTTDLVTDQNIPGIREVTLRSMMGDYGGHAGLLGAWWDEETGRWKIEVSTCSFGVQHIWWAVHILDIITLFVCVLAASAYAFSVFGSKQSKKPKQSKATGKGTSNSSMTKREKPVENGTAKRDKKL